MPLIPENNQALKTLNTFVIVYRTGFFDGVDTTAMAAQLAGVATFRAPVQPFEASEFANDGQSQGHGGCGIEAK